MQTWQATLTLSGGGARGVAHLGAIEELLRVGLIADRVVGVSIGALAGAMYAFEPDISVVQQRASEYLRSPEFARHQRYLLGARTSAAEKAAAWLHSGYHRMAEYMRANRMMYRAVQRGSFLPGMLLESIVDHLLPDADIDDARIPLSIVAVDLHTGRPMVFEKGPLRLAVRASASVPGVFPPVEYEGRLLSDIGGFYALPLGVARAYSPDLLVAIDVDARLKPLTKPPTALEVLIRMNHIGAAMFREHLSEEADLTILPELGETQWFDFRSFETMMEAGRSATRSALASFKPPQSWLQRLFSRRGVVDWNTGDSR